MLLLASAVGSRLENTSHRNTVQNASLFHACMHYSPSVQDALYRNGSYIGEQEEAVESELRQRDRRSVLRSHELLERKDEVTVDHDT